MTLIFDLDGTLLNTLDDLHESVCVALERMGLPLLPKADTRRYLGNGVNNLIGRCVEHVCPDADVELVGRVLGVFRPYYVEHSMDRTAPYDGVMGMLQECRRRGCATAIVSNKLDAAVKVLHRRFFADVVDVAIGETPSVKRKPAPDMVDVAIRELSQRYGREIRKGECVYVGDSEVDLLTAKNAGLECVAVSWGFRDREYLVECGAKTMIDHPDELFAKVDCL